MNSDYDGLWIAEVMSIDSDEMRIAERWLIRELRTCPRSAKELKRFADRVGLEWTLVERALVRLKLRGKLYVDQSLSMDRHNPLWCERAGFHPADWTPVDDSDLPPRGFVPKEAEGSAKPAVDDAWSIGKVIAFILFWIFLMNLSGHHSPSCVRDYLGGCVTEEEW